MDYLICPRLIGGRYLHERCRFFGIYLIPCILSLVFTLSLSLSLKPLFSTSLCACCLLWELGVESALELILLGFVGELPFLCLAVFRNDASLLSETLML